MSLYASLIRAYIQAHIRRHFWGNIFRDVLYVQSTFGSLHGLYARFLTGHLIHKEGCGGGGHWQTTTSSFDIGGSQIRGSGGPSILLMNNQNLTQ